MHTGCDWVTVACQSYTVQNVKWVAVATLLLLVTACAQQALKLPASLCIVTIVSTHRYGDCLAVGEICDLTACLWEERHNL